MTLLTIVEDAFEKLRGLLGEKVGEEVMDDVHADIDQAKAQVAQQLAAAGHVAQEDVHQVLGQAGQVASDTAAAVAPEHDSLAPGAPAAG